MANWPSFTLHFSTKEQFLILSQTEKFLNKTLGPVVQSLTSTYPWLSTLVITYSKTYRVNLGLALIVLWTTEPLSNKFRGPEIGETAKHERLWSISYITFCAPLSRSAYSYPAHVNRPLSIHCLSVRPTHQYCKGQVHFTGSVAIGGSRRFSYVGCDGDATARREDRVYRARLAQWELSQGVLRYHIRYDVCGAPATHLSVVCYHCAEAERGSPQDWRQGRVQGSTSQGQGRAHAYSRRGLLRSMLPTFPCHIFVVGVWEWRGV